jgi:hypothetical protein
LSRTVFPPLSPRNPVCTAAEIPVTQTSELFTTTLGELAVDGVLSTTVFPDEVDTVLELLLTVEDTVEEVTVSVAYKEEGNKATRSINDITLMTIILT